MTLLPILRACQAFKKLRRIFAFHRNEALFPEELRSSRHQEYTPASQSEGLLYTSVQEFLAEFQLPLGNFVIEINLIGKKRH